MSDQFKSIVQCVKNLYPGLGFVPLHEPRFQGKEKQYVEHCIDSSFVSSVGEYVTRFEDMIKDYTGARFAIATVNGTTALYLSLILAGVRPGDEVLTQALTFVATANAVSYAGAVPHFLDVDRQTLGLSPHSLEEFLDQGCETRDDGFSYSRTSGRKIAACVPMHTFGHPARIDEIAAICEAHGIVLIEDAAESLGSRFKKRHTGCFGKLGIFSFNGNKIITCGGGGMIVTDDPETARLAKHLTTQAKLPHKWEFVHDMVGYNFRLPNLNAALACAQMERLEDFVENKRTTADLYLERLSVLRVELMLEPDQCRSNYWLNAILLENRAQRDAFLEYSNCHGVMTRPVWKLMNELEMYKNCPAENLDSSRWLGDRIVNIPSSVRINHHA